jgi:signal transduction histidine kinase/DNA-binding response OmpR family regulator
MDRIKTIAALCLYPKISAWFVLCLLISFSAQSAGIVYGNIPDSTNAPKKERSQALAESYDRDHTPTEILVSQGDTPAFDSPSNSFVLLFFLLLAVSLALFIYLIAQTKKTRMLLKRELEINGLKSRFYANLTHEFRSPLTLILGPIEEMMARGESLQMRHYLTPMRKNAQRLLELVNELLELSRIESGKLRLSLTRTDILAVVRGVVMSFESLAAMKHMRLAVITGEYPEDIFVDRDKIEKILSNLLSNALKFTPEKGSITVDVRRTSGHDPALAECLEILVKDNGSGIAQAEQEHIFDRYFQVENNEGRKQDGYGVGLALTKELVELHRGTIRAYSDGKTGTEIYIQLPLNLDLVMKECIAETAVMALDSPLAGRRPDGGEEFRDDAGRTESAGHESTVLLIEDNADVRRYVRDTLASVYEIIEAANGEEGIALAKDKIPDLILCDVLMPEINGYQVCASLKDDERTSHIPIILVTAKADMESRIEGLETGADDYLMKPFVAKELTARIRNLIESRRKLREHFHHLVLKPGEVAVNSLDEQFLKRMVCILEGHMADDKFTTEDLSEEMGMSRSHLHRKLKSLVGQGPNQFIRSFRLNRAHEMLRRNSGTAAEIAYAVGFGSPSYFTKCFHEKFGYTPSELINH